MPGRGHADGGVPLPAVLDYLRSLVAATDLPVNADFEHGFADDAGGRGAATWRWPWTRAWPACPSKTPWPALMRHCCRWTRRCSGARRRRHRRQRPG